MRKMGIGSALVVGALLVWGGTGGADEGKKLKQKVEMAGAATVTIDQAVKTASEKVAGKVIEAELETKHDKTVWEVEIVTADGKVMEVHVDAATGAVIDVEDKAAEPKKEKKDKKKERKGRDD